MERMLRIAVTTILTLFFGVASLTAAENIPPEEMTVYSFQEVVCTAERTPSMDTIAIVLPDISNIGIVMATTEGMLAAIDEKDVYVLPEVVCTAERTPSMTDITVAVADMSNIGVVMATMDDMLVALDEEVNMFPENRNSYSTDVALVPPRRPMRAFAMMRPPVEKRMNFQKHTLMPFPL